jgi:hypothetical protein
MLIGAAKPVGRPKVAPCSKMAIVDSGLSRTTILDKAFHVVSLSFEGSHTSLLQELSGLETCQTNSIVTMVLMGPGNSGPQKLNGFVFPDLKTGLKSCPETRQATGLSELGLVDLGVQWTVYTLSWEWGCVYHQTLPIVAQQERVRLGQIFQFFYVQFSIFKY